MIEPSEHVTFELKTIDDLRAVWPHGKAETETWVFFGTSGAHGCYGGLDRLFKDSFFKDGKSLEERSKQETDSITVLVVQPELVQSYFGHIEVKRTDLDFLRSLATATQTAVAYSQRESWEE